MSIKRELNLELLFQAGLTTDEIDVLVACSQICKCNHIARVHLEETSYCEVNDCECSYFKDIGESEDHGEEDYKVVGYPR